MHSRPVVKTIWLDSFFGFTFDQVVKRRTQEERTAQMRVRLLDATIECLVRLGYAGTTTTAVAERAGVSRGAQLHHFPSKEELVLAALEHLFYRREREFRAAFARLPAGADRTAVAIDLLWKIVRSDIFYAWLELAIAGRTDKKLGRRVRELGNRVAAEADRTFFQLFPPPSGPPNPIYAMVPHITFTVLYGLALDRLLVTAPVVNPGKTLELMKQVFPLAFPRRSR